MPWVRGKERRRLVSQLQGPEITVHPFPTAEPKPRPLSLPQTQEAKHTKEGPNPEAATPPQSKGILSVSSHPQPPCSWGRVWPVPHRHWAPSHQFLPNGSHLPQAKGRRNRTLKSSNPPQQPQLPTALTRSESPNWETRLQRSQD